MVTFETSHVKYHLLHFYNKRGKVVSSKAALSETIQQNSTSHQGLAMLYHNHVFISLSSPTFSLSPFLKLPGEMKKLCLSKSDIGVAGKIHTAKHEHVARELLSQMDLTTIAVTMKIIVVIYSPLTVIMERRKEINALVYRTEPKSPHIPHSVRQAAIQVCKP